MLFSMWSRMALVAAVIRSANLLRSVSCKAASYKHFQSEAVWELEIEEAMGTGMVARQTMGCNPSKVVVSDVLVPVLAYSR
jgi:hypothetical protein